ncbi:chitinase [Streptomyces phytohabitans]|uniref:chitinase n=1 Tax=Streptomyces phytohabitans TaxID=1150371 RepID=UPI00345BFDC3
MIRWVRRHATARASAFSAALLAALAAAAPAAPPPADPAPVAGRGRAPAAPGGAAEAGLPGRGAVAPSRTLAAPLRPALPGAVSPYLSLGWGDAPDPLDVMRETGVRWFTLAFVLSDGECAPRWDGVRPLTGGADEEAVRAVRAAGGDVIASFGGGLGHRLEQSCPDGRSLADAYQRVIDAYALEAVDVDIETEAYEDPAARAKTVEALKRVRARNPGLTLYVTLPSHPHGPDRALIDEAAREGVDVDAWTIMPFAFGESARGRDMGTLTIEAVEGLKDTLRSAYGYGDAEAYRRSGVSTMNGLAGRGEVMTLEHFAELKRYAERTGLARLAFWSVNRDRACGGGGYRADDTCSGVRQRPWAYTRALTGYVG